MFSPLRNHFGIPGVIAVIALVFAMFGGAYAANNHRHHKKKGQAGLNAKQKKQVRAIAKNYAGPAGPQGPVGGKGDNGANGSNGAQGEKGDKGDPGTGATATAYTGEECEEASGEEGIKVTSAGSPTYVCNGENGTFEPNGFTQTGTLTAPAGGSAVEVGTSTAIPVSFSIPLEAAPTFVPVKAEEDKSGEGCSGTLDSEGNLEGGVPTAAPGTLCVYLTTPGPPIYTVDITSYDPTQGFAVGTSSSGAVLSVECVSVLFGSGCPVKGVWAVTG